MLSINSKKQHFDTFDALRFISFLIVFLSHIPIPSTSLFNFVSHSGNIGVTFFFVLSGFLITYILLHEKVNTNTINLKSFLFRRILRIWPLFYLMILFAFATPIILDHLHLPSSNQGYDPNWIVSCLFLENYVMMFTNSFPNASPLRVMWSLCVEEHFYIIWGLFIYLLPLKRIPILIIGSILLANITRIIYYNFDITCYDIFSNIDYFAFGAIPAFIIIIKPEFFSKINNLPREILILILSVTLILVLFAPHLDNVYLGLALKPIFGLLFMLSIVSTLLGANKIHINDSNLMSKLGKYTYGSYLYHTIFINLCLQLNNKLSLNLNWIAIGLVSLVLTIAMSIISFHYFEKYFLKFKDRAQTV